MKGCDEHYLTRHLTVLYGGKNIPWHTTLDKRLERLHPCSTIVYNHRCIAPSVIYYSYKHSVTNYIEATDVGFMVTKIIVVSMLKFRMHKNNY